MAGIFEVDGKQMSSFHSAVLFHMPKPSYMNTGVSDLEFNVPFQHKHGYIRNERSGMESYPYPLKEG